MRLACLQKIKLFCCHTLVDLQKFKKDEKKLGDDFRKKIWIAKSVVMCVASIQERKGIFLILLKQQNPCLITNLFGLANISPYLEIPAKNPKDCEKSPKNVLFVCHVEKNDLANAYNAANLFVLPSYSETFGLVIAEAASLCNSSSCEKSPEFSYFGILRKCFRIKEFEAQNKANNG